MQVKPFQPLGNKVKPGGKLKPKTKKQKVDKYLKQAYKLTQNGN